MVSCERNTGAPSRACASAPRRRASAGADIAAMLEAAGVEVSERAGSRVLLKKGVERMIVHRPQPARRRAAARCAP